MATVLVSGAPGKVREVADALRARGADVVEVVDLKELPSVCADAGPRAFGSYVQLPSTFDISGDTAIERVRHFYADGVLARFPALSAALPTLTPGARLTFVLGSLPDEVASDDDRAARGALTRVLAHAAQADSRPSQLVVQVLESTATPDAVAAAALSEDAASAELMERLSQLSYDDWRVELLGLVAVNT